MTPDTMRAVLASGANLVVYFATSDLMRELVTLAVHSGGHVTFRFSVYSDLARELAELGRSHVTFDPAPRPPTT